MNTARFLVGVIALIAGAAARGQADTSTVFVDDPRPLKAAVLSILERYPITITYEDPVYAYSGDIKDVTEQVRKHASNNNSRILVPTGGVLQSSYLTERTTGRPVDAAEMVKNIVDAKNANPVGGRFGVYQSGDVFHIVPTEAPDAKGIWVSQRSILETPITFTSPEVDGYKLIEAVLRRVSEVSGANILGLAGSFNNTLFRYHGTVEATNEPARDVLMRVLHSINPRFTWLLNYDPSGHYYVFNLAMAAEPPPKAVPLDLSSLPSPGAPNPTGISSKR